MTEINERVKSGYSNVSQLFGMHIVEADSVNGIIEATFQAGPQFTNSIGNVQGGILTAMLDDLMGYALGITMPKTHFAPTANLNVSFLRPAALGELHGRGEILKKEGPIYHLAGKIFNENNELLAAATCKAKEGLINIA